MDDFANTKFDTKQSTISNKAPKPKIIETLVFLYFFCYITKQNTYRFDKKNSLVRL